MSNLPVLGECCDGIALSAQKAADLVRTALGGGINVRIQLCDGSIFDVHSPVIVSSEAIQFPTPEINQLVTVRLDEIVAVQSRLDTLAAA